MSIERGAEYFRLRNLLIATMSSIVVLSIIRYGALGNFFASSGSKSTNKSSSNSNLFESKNYRPVVESNGKLTVNLHRHKTNRFTLIDANDRGDLLYLTSPSDAPYREFLKVSNGKEETPVRTQTDVRLSLAENGNVIKRLSPTRILGSGRFSRFFGGPISYPYNELRFYRSLLDDGSVINVRYNAKANPPKYSLVRTFMGGKEEITYTTDHGINILDRGDDGSILLEEVTVPNSANNDLLVRLKDGQREEIPMPDGYQSVSRATSTGSILAATFGRISGKDPVRSYMRTDEVWKELPIPKGFQFSYVQRVLNNGMILGFVTDPERVKFSQVVWKDDKVQLLDELPAWPKNGLFSFVVLATRHGELYVRNVMDSSSGTSEYYLLSVEP